MIAPGKTSPKPPSGILNRLPVRLSVLSLSVLLIAGCPGEQTPSTAQGYNRGSQQSGPAGYADSARSSRLIERFRQFDHNGDGTLTLDEVGRPGLFERLDQNADSLVTLEEARIYVRNRRQLAYNTNNTSMDAAPSALPPVAEARAYSRADTRSLTATDAAINRYPNLRYAAIPGVDPNLLSLDVYAPKTGQQHPVVVMIHGGGWQRGDKANPNVGIEKAQFLVPRGYVYVSINYRLSPAVRHPAHVQDVAKALVWINDNINRYGGDPDRIYLMGHSSGAHLAALVSTDEQYLRALNKNLGMIKGVILLDTATYNLGKRANQVGEAGARRRGMLFEDAFGADRKTLSSASPINHVAPNKGIPRFLIFTPSGPDPARANLSQEFASTLNRAGAPAKVITVPGKNHQAMNSDAGRPGDILTTNILEFLKTPPSTPTPMPTSRMKQ